MELVLQLILTFLMGIVAAYIGALGGPGGLLSIPFLIFLGLPPSFAVATNKVGSLGLNLSTTIRYFKHIVWKHIIAFSLIAIGGAIIGANILLNINENFIPKLVGLITLLLLPLIFIKKEVGIKRIKVSKFRLILGYFSYTLLMIFGGFFGGGAGPIRSYILMHFFGLTMIEQNATHRIPSLFLAVSSLIVFIIAGIVDYKVGASLFLGMFAGGYLGASTAIKKGNSWVKIVFGIIVILFGIKIIVF